MAKRICFFNGNINRSGGTERVMSIIANLLSKYPELDVYVLSLYEGDNPFFKLDSSIKQNSLFKKEINFSRNYPSAVKRLRAFITSNDINVFIDVEVMLTLFSLPALFGLKNVNHIAWEHLNFKNNLGKKLRSLSRQLAAVFVDHVVTLTKRDTDFWRSNTWMRANLINIPNPVTHISDRPVTSLNNKVFLAIGHLIPVKGFDLLLEAWALATKELDNSWKLHIVGDGEEKRRLELLCQQLLIETSVFFFPSTNQIDEHYYTASYLCLSSRFEGLPMVLLEAQSLGIPCIAFDCITGPAEIIVNGKNGYLCNNGDVNDLAAKIILSSKQSSSQYDLMSQNCLHHIENYSIDSITPQWLKIINS